MRPLGGTHNAKSAHLQRTRKRVIVVIQSDTDVQMYTAKICSHLCTRQPTKRIKRAEIERNSIESPTTTKKIPTKRVHKHVTHM